jgi:hypothetical protein
MILPVFEPIVPALLGVAGAILVLAGILVIAHHRHRALVPLGVLTVLAGVTIAAPATVAETAGTAVEATTGTVASLLERGDSAPPEIMAEDTGAAP